MILNKTGKDHSWWLIEIDKWTRDGIAPVTKFMEALLHKVGEWMIFMSIQTLACDNNYTDLSKKNLQWCNTKKIKISANLFSCEVTFKSYLRNLTKQIHNAMSCDWTKNSAPCPVNASHKNSESIAHPFIYYSDVVTLYEHNLESTDNFWQPKQIWIF
jgi:hypothetical protein